MTTTPTERRLAITPGDTFASSFQVWEKCPGYAFGRFIADLRNAEVTSEEAGRLTDLFVDARNVHQACGLTPSELLAKVTKLRSERDELVGALASVCNLENKLRIFERIIVDNPGRTDVRPSAADISSMIADAMDARAILSKHKPE